MQRFSTILATLLLLAGGARTLARADAPRGFSASGPLHANGPEALAAVASSEQTPRSAAAGEPQITFNRSKAAQISPQGTAAETTTTPRPGNASGAAARLPLGAPQGNPVAAPAGTTDWLDQQANKPITTALAGLSIVLAAFLLLAWTVRKRMPKGSARLPDEIIEVLGRTTLAAKQSLHLIRVGGKLIVVSVTTAGTETLTEITDPTEVARILAACQQQNAHSSTAAFRQVFEQLGREPAHGFLGAEPDRTRASTSQTRAA